MSARWWSVLTVGVDALREIGEDAAEQLPCGGVHGRAGHLEGRRPAAHLHVPLGRARPEKRAGGCQACEYKGFMGGGREVVHVPCVRAAGCLAQLQGAPVEDTRSGTQ